MTSRSLVFLTVVGVLWTWDLVRPLRRFFARRTHLKQRLRKGTPVCPSCRLPFDKGKKRRLLDTCGHQRCYACLCARDACPLCPAEKTPSLDVRLRHSDDGAREKPLTGSRPNTVSVDDPRYLSAITEDRKFKPRRHTVFDTVGENGNSQSSITEEMRFSQQYSTGSMEDSEDSYEKFFRPSYDKRASNESLKSSLMSIGSRSSAPAVDLLVPDEHGIKLDSKRFSLARCSNFSLDLSPDKSVASKSPSVPPTPPLRLKPLYFEVPQSETDSVLSARNWVLREIEKAVWCDDSRGATLIGGAGTGKTSLILQLVDHSSFGRKWEETLFQTTSNIYSKIDSYETSCSEDDDIPFSAKGAPNSNFCSNPLLAHLASRVVGYHFCQAECNETCLVPDFVHSLAAQLCQAPQLIEYRNFLLKDESCQQLLSLNSCIEDPDSAFVRGILEPLISLTDVSKAPALLLVDSLHEADKISYFLATHLSKFPTWLKVVLSVRTGREGAIYSFPLRQVKLDGFGIEIQNDVLRYIWYRMNTSNAIRGNIVGYAKHEDGDATARFAHHLAELSKGSFLYVKLTLDLLQRNHLVVKSGSFGVVPVSLDQVFTLTFNLRFPSAASFSKVKPILEVCLASLCPLTALEVFYSISAAHKDQCLTWLDLARRLHWLKVADILIQRRDGSLMLAHPALREWLTDKEGHKFACDARFGHTALALLITRFKHPFSSERQMEFAHHLLKCDVFSSSASDPGPKVLRAFWSQLSPVDPTTALVHHRNVFSPDTEIYRLLLESGADANASYGTEAVPLLTVASKSGFTEIVPLLLEFGAHCDARGVNGTTMTPLMAAASQGRLPVVQILLLSKAKIELQDLEGRCALCHAAAGGHLETADFLARFPWPTELSLKRSEAVNRALVTAARCGHLEICGYLLEKASARVNAVDIISGHTSLTAACEKGQVDVCRLLLTKGASVGTPGKATDGEQTPLSWAASQGSLPLLQLLLDAGANINTKDGNGLSALSWACIRNRAEAVEFLLQKGADVESQDSNLRTPILFAAIHGSADVVNILLSKGAEVEHMSIDKSTPLDLAVASGNLQAVSRFLHRGVKLGSKAWEKAQGQPKMILVLLHKLLSDGVVLYKQENFGDASYRFQYALKKCPSTLEEERTKLSQLQYHLYLGLSRCKRKMQEYDAAIEAATEASQLRPESFEAFYVRARARHEAGHYPEALADVSEALKVSNREPYTARILQNLRAEILTSSKVVSPLEAVDDDTTLSSRLTMTMPRKAAARTIGQFQPMKKYFSTELHN